MDEQKRFKAEPTSLFVVRIISNCLLVVSFDAAFGMLFSLPPILVCISSLEMLIYLALAMLLRRKFKSLFMFGLVHIAGILLVTFGAPYMFYVHLVLASWISVLALYDYISGHRMLYPGIFHIVYPFVMFIAGFTTDSQNVIVLSVITETVFMVLFMLRRNFESLDHVFISSSKYVRVPYARMRRMNTYLAVVFILASIVVAVILGLIFDGEQLIYLIGKGFVLIMAGVFVGIVWLFSHLFPNADDVLAAASAGNMGSLFAELENHPLLMLLWHLFEYAMYAVTIVVVTFLAYRFIRDLYYEFRSAVPENGDKRVFLQTREEREEIETAKRPKKPGFSEKDRVRRKYIRLVRESGRQGEISHSMTPEEIEEKVGRPELTALHEDYERARYG